MGNQTPTWPTKHHHRLGRNIPLHEWGPKPTKNRPITNRSIPTRQLDITINQQNTTTIRPTGSKSKGSQHTPGLKKPLISVNKMSENGYTTIFWPGNQGVTIHKEGTLTITTSEPPILKGSKAKGAKLWTVSTNQTQNNTLEQALNAYSLPSIGQTIKYLHAAAGYPTEETWIKAIWAGNYNTWPSLTIANAHKHHPGSKETQKGHIKCQHQGIQSTKTLADINKNEGDEAKIREPTQPKPADWTKG